jgi:hypothetical protein
VFFRVTVAEEDDSRVGGLWREDATLGGRGNLSPAAISPAAIGCKTRSTPDRKTVDIP